MAQNAKVDSAAGIAIQTFTSAGDRMAAVSDDVAGRKDAAAWITVSTCGAGVAGEANVVVAAIRTTSEDARFGQWQVALPPPLPVEML